MRKRYLYFTGIFLGLILMGCDGLLNEDGDKVDVDVAGAQLKADGAIGALENELFSFINAIDTISGLGGIDFSGSNTLFIEALVLDPANKDANFGAALTGMMTFTQDAEVQAVFDAWAAFVDTGSAFVADPLSSPMAVGGMFFPGSFSRSMVAPDDKGMAEAYLTLHKMAVGDPPTVADIQAVVESIFIPALDSAVNRFAVVASSGDYTFTITPRMQGDLNEVARELDLTEVYLMMSGINILRSFARVAVAYNVGPTAYDSAAIVPFLSQGEGGFLSLKTTGAANMATAKTALLDATLNIDAAIAYLRSETDDQSDDLIKIAPGDVTEADLDSVVKFTADFREKFETGFTITEDWDNNPATADEDITFRFSAFFDNPISDFKSLLPSYSVTVGRDTSYYSEYHDSSYTISMTVNLPADIPGFYFYDYSAWWDDYEGVVQSFENSDLPDSILALFRVVADSLQNVFLADPGIMYWNIYLSWNGSLEAGDNLIQISVQTSWEEGIPDYVYFTGIITFAANSAAEWILPNPTFNGFLPGMTDSDIKRITQFTDADFQKEIIIPFEFGQGQSGQNSIASPVAAMLVW